MNRLAFGGSQERQRAARIGAGGPERTRLQPRDKDGWHVVGDGTARVRESAGSNGILRNDEGRSLIVQKKEYRSNGSFRWVDVKDPDEARELLGQNREPRDEGNQTDTQAIEPSQERPKPNEERFNSVNYQKSGERQQDDKVALVQRELNEIGYDVEVDGYYGDQTKRAVAQFLDRARQDPELRRLVPAESQNDGSEVNSILLGVMQRVRDRGGF